MNDKIIKFNSSADLKLALAGEYRKTLENFFGDEKQALEFLSNVVSEVQKNPKLLECTSETVLNSFMTMASLKLMPSSVSGEAYVLPYKKAGVMQAQFQIGYQGLVTLFYRSGVEKIYSEIVREKDKYSLSDGEFKHEIDLNLSMEERGNPVGAYVTIIYKGKKNTKFMNGKDILNHGKKFSKSFGGDYSPWSEKNDPELWMWKKTVLKQISKLLPKNSNVLKAIDEDNKDSIISDIKEKKDIFNKRVLDAEESKESLKIGNFIKNDETKEDKEIK